jgi:hypothetical protein
MENIFSADSSGTDAFAATHHVAGDTLSAAASTDSVAMPEDAANTLGSIRPYFAVYAPPQAHDLAKTTDQGHVNHEIGCRTELSRAAIFGADGEVPPHDGAVPPQPAPELPGNTRERANQELSRMNQEIKRANQELSRMHEEIEWADQELSQMHEEIEWADQELSRIHQEIERAHQELSPIHQESEPVNENGNLGRTDQEISPP